MRRLPALDAWLLDLESPAATGHVGMLVGVDVGAVDGWGADHLRAVLEARLHTVRSLSQRLVSAPLGMGGRFLDDDPHFDLEYHVRELVLPSPGTTQQLTEQVAAIHARPLDRSRPLWELHVVTGRDDGTAAVYAKVHRILVDGRSGQEVLHALLDSEPEPMGTEPDPTPPGVARHLPDFVLEGVRSLVNEPRELGYAVPDALLRLGRFAAGAGLPGSGLVTGAADVAGRLLRPEHLGQAREVAAPRTRLDAPLTPHRRLATGSLPMADVTRACDHLGMRVDELVLALTATAVRLWLLDHDALPVTALVAAVPVPVAVEAEDVETEQGEAMVRLTPVHLELPTHLRHASERAAAARDAATAVRQDLDVVADKTLEALASTSPLALADLTARAMSRLALAPGASANLTVSHTPGPPTPLYLAGAPVHAVVPVSALGPATGGLAVTSYAFDDRLHLGLTACREIVPDVWNVLGYLTDALAELLPAS